MTLARKNAQLAQTISVSGNAIGDTLFIPSSGLVNVSGVLNLNGIPVSVSGHSHPTSDITNFNSSVSGILNDALSTSIVGGSGVSIVYDSEQDQLSINVTGIPNIDIATTGVYGITILTNTIDDTETKALTPKGLNDALSTSLVSGSGISLIYNNSNNTLTIHAVITSLLDDYFSNIPTTNPAVSGKLWNDNGTLKISNG